MYNLLVLGHIPGTPFSINFEFWLTCVVATAALLAARRARRSKALGSMVVTSAVLIAVRSRRMRA